MQVIKRDGRKVDFDINKISEAVRKAYTEVYPNVNVYIDSIIADISGRIDDLGFSEITIEQIQDIVEKELMNDDKDEMIENFDTAVSHPDETDLQKLKYAVAQCIKC